MNVKNRRSGTGIGKTAVLALALAVPAGAADDGMLFNGWFNGSTAGWSSSAGNGTFGYSPLDQRGTPGSGSALGSNQAVGTYGGITMSQCVSGIAPGMRYLAGADVLEVASSDRSGHADLTVQWYSGAVCDPFTGVGQQNLAAAASGAPGSWQPLRAITDPAPANASSAFLVLWVVKTQAGGALAYHFDNAYLCTQQNDCTILFRDGFESGGFEAWSDWHP